MNLEDAAAASPDIDYRHLYAELEENDKDEFSQRIGKLLDNCARTGFRVMHLATSKIVRHNGFEIRVAQVILVAHRSTLDQFAGGATGYVDGQEMAERIIGFRTSSEATEPA